MELEKVKELVYQSDEINWLEVIKDLIMTEVGQNKLIVFKDKYGCYEHFYLYSVGDPNEYVVGAAIIDDKLFVMTNNGDGEDSEFGTAFMGDFIKRTSGIGLTKDAIIKMCKAVFEKKFDIEYNFDEAENVAFWYKEFFASALKRNSESFDLLKSGKINGFFYTI
jgi:hypothetical protein